MAEFKECVFEFKKQLKKGMIQKAYLGIMDYIMNLRTHFMKRYSEYGTPGSIYHGYLDMTYFALFPPQLKKQKLKIAIVFNYEAFRFEIWLSGVNKKAQADIWKWLNEEKFNKYPLVSNIAGSDAIVEHILADEPNFGSIENLTKQIEKGAIEFIDALEKQLSSR